MNDFDLFWLFWLGGFIVLEMLAIVYVNRKQKAVEEGATLSELVRRIIRQNRLVYVIFAIFWLYLFLHFAGFSIGNYSF